MHSTHMRPYYHYDSSMHSFLKTIYQERSNPFDWRESWLKGSNLRRPREEVQSQYSFCNLATPVQLLSPRRRNCVYRKVKCKMGCLLDELRSWMVAKVLITKHPSSRIAVS